MNPQDTGSQPPHAVVPGPPPVAPADTRIQPAGALAAHGRPAQRRRRRWSYAIAGVLLLASLPLLLYAYLTWTADRDQQAAIDEIERLDPRWRFEHLMADRKPIPDEENPAVVVAKADALLQPKNYDIGRKNDWLFENDPPSVHQLNAPQIVVLREALTRHADAVKLARTLKDFSGEGRFNIRVAPDFISTSLEPLQRCRGVIYMLQHDAMLRAEDGDAQGSLESCQAILVAARAIGDEPYLIAALIRHAGEAICVNALERTLAQGEPPAAQLKSMQDLLAREIDATFFVQAMRGERGGSDAMIATLKKGNIKMSALMGRPGGGNNLEDWLVDAFPGILLRGRAEHLRLMNQAVEAAKLPPEQQGKAFDAIEKDSRASKAPLVRLLTPACTKVSQAHRRTRATMRCALVGVAAERFRLQHDQWPASIEGLVKDNFLAAVPLDPFDGQPLRYKLVADGLLIYSVGLDGVDDGGVINRENPFTPGSDLGFRLWNAEVRRQAPLPLPPPPDDDGAPR